MNAYADVADQATGYRARCWGGCVLAVGMAVLLLGLVNSGMAQQPAGPGAQGPFVRTPVAPAVQEANLRALTRTRIVRAWHPGDPVRVIEDLKERLQPASRGAGQFQEAREEPPEPVSAPAQRRASVQGQSLTTAGSTVAGVSFDGIPATGSLPPDTVGDVGPNHYVQMVNTVFAIYDKEGNLLAGPSPISTLWSGFGGPCETENNGDPIVRYDHLADRWLLSQFALPGPDLHECIAISRTSDPVSGGWYLYDFPTVDANGNPVFPDYPKIGVWPDGYYMGTQRGFPSGGLDVWVFERDKMLIGAPAGVVQFSVPAPSLFLMPSDLDGPPPPAGTPNFFARQVDGERFGGNDRVEVFAFSVNWTTPASSTFTQVANLPTAPFDSVLCSSTLLGACIPQPGTTRRLETLTVWPMWRLQYRNFGTYEAMVFNHTVDVDARDHAGIRWYELRRPPDGTWSIFQQGTHAPDNVHRWMGSIAMDRDGNMALGYSASSDTVFPGIRYASRVASDPPGTITGEATLVVGGGSQTHGSSRWGNYSSMDVDPQDDCTFWYTTEYYEATSAAGWRTRISSFRQPTCGVGERMHEYAAKLVCGLQKDPQGMRLTRGFYGTAINIHNPNREAVTFRKKLALTFPPDEQKPGRIMPIAEDKLESDEALEVDCQDIQRKLFPDGFPESYIKGFVVIQSRQSLDVTAVYTTASLDREGQVAGQNGIDVEQIRERIIEPQKPRLPDLKVQSIGRPQVSCPGGPGTCVTVVSVRIANVGIGDAGAFNVRTVLDPTQSVVVNQAVSGLPIGEQTLTVTTPPGGNCFDPDCTICVTVDSANAVTESDEGNNNLCATTPG